MSALVSGKLLVLTIPKYVLRSSFLYAFFYFLYYILLIGNIKPIFFIKAAGYYLIVFYISVANISKLFLILSYLNDLF